MTYYITTDNKIVKSENSNLIGRSIPTEEGEIIQPLTAYTSFEEAQKILSGMLDYTIESSEIVIMEAKDTLKEFKQLKKSLREKTADDVEEIV